RKEWNFWMSNPSLVELPVDAAFKAKMLRSARKNLLGVQQQIDLVEPNTELAPGITTVAAFGHSPGQMAVEISSAGERLLFVADAVVLPLHLEFPGTIGMTDHYPS